LPEISGLPYRYAPRALCETEQGISGFAFWVTGLQCALDRKLPGMTRWTPRPAVEMGRMAGLLTLGASKCFERFPTLPRPSWPSGLVRWRIKTPITVAGAAAQQETCFQLELLTTLSQELQFAAKGLNLNHLGPILTGL